LLKQRINLLGIWISFLIVYIEWGKSAEFLVEMQFDILIKAKSSLSILIVPVILIPFIGQVIIIYSAFKNIPNKKTGAVGIVFCAIPVVLVFLGGILTGRERMVISSLPFFAMSFLFLKRRLISQKVEGENL